MNACEWCGKQKNYLLNINLKSIKRKGFMHRIVMDSEKLICKTNVVWLSSTSTTPKCNIHGQKIMWMCAYVVSIQQGVVYDEILKPTICCVVPPNTQQNLLTLYYIRMFIFEVDHPLALSEYAFGCLSHSKLTFHDHNQVQK